MNEQTSTLLERRKESPSGAGHYHVVSHYPYRIRVSISGRTVADTERAIVLKEVGTSVYDPAFYIPSEDVKSDLLEREDGFTTHCPIKGDASYWTFKGADEAISRAAWSYDKPLDYSSAIAGHLGFDQRFATIEISPAIEQ